MIIIVAETEDAIHIKTIIGFQTRMDCAIRGVVMKDITDLFNTLKTYEAAGNKKKIILMATMCEDEDVVAEYLQDDMKDQFFHKSQEMAQMVQHNMNQHAQQFQSNSSIPFVQPKPTAVPPKDTTIKCPKCNSLDGLKDSKGTIHPCKKCQKIDLGLEISKERKARIRTAHIEEHKDDSQPEGTVKDGK